ncbi:CCA tRNA nucleotidyltransferase [Sphingomonas daechungensis]|uniref:CCA tRNA nucleotidyltransferase n=1 Tax=Sphingomonas daechungensis TaxID=1176646 RepID=A0ABX6T1K6_9SPHN|nr:CCA tRNA nucleotidyltransferase [Sphingomonas daechungensis]QNP43381.1 CCA tRNA nucleotidyltransferase [Sphingomonas daechungensis]
MELSIDAPKWRRLRGAARLLDALGASEGQTRYVGGAVRDQLLGIPVNDVDLATKLRPDEVISRLESAKIRAVPTGIEHGTITAISNGHAFEVTTLRKDVSTDGRRATVAFTDDWQEDAARRDFTINALSADPNTGQVHDYFGGKDDLLARRVRFIGDPLERIAEDHLRILRYFRFHARFGQGEMDTAALDACETRANDLMALSRERIADELLKLLSVADPAPTVAVMLDRSILLPVLPEIQPGAIGRLRALVEGERAAGIEGDPLRRLASLLPRDAASAERVAARLKLSNKARKRLGFAAGGGGEENAMALAYFSGTEPAVDRLLLNGQPEAAAEIAVWRAPRLPISGGGLIERGLTPGPAVAKALRAIEERWVASGFPKDSGFDTIVNDAIRSALP